jgi:ABC-type multidrug transport system fused ATPase/permease subunit
MHISQFFNFMTDNRKYHYIYKTVNLINSNFYIGMHSTNNIKDGYMGSGNKIKSSIRHYGKNNHKFEILSKRLDKLALKATFAGAAMTPITQLLAAISLSIVISYAIVDSAANSGTVGEFVAFITAMLMIITPLRQLSEVSNPITRGIALLNESKEFIETSIIESPFTFNKNKTPLPTSVTGSGNTSTTTF